MTRHIRGRRRTTSGTEPTEPSPDAAAATHPTRRLILRTALVGGVVVAGGLVWRADRQGVFAPLGGTAFDAWRRDRGTGSASLAAAAVLAASAHNMQNWLLHLRDDRIDLYDDTDRTLGVVDPFRREAHLGLGCALANLELAGPPAGYAVRTTLATAAADDEPVATGHLDPRDPESDALFRAIGHRHSDRGPYPDDTPPRAVLDRLTATATSGAPDVTVRWLTTPIEREEAGVLLVDAAEALVADEAMSRDGAAWFRDDPAQVARTMDGLTLDAQALPGPVELAAKMLPPVSRGRADATWVRMTRDVHTATARAYGLVLGPRGDLPARLTAGRALQRLHLALTGEGWAMQHLNQAIELAEREESTGRSPVFGDRLRALAGGDDVLAMIRTGRPSGRATASPRRPYEWVLI